MDVDWDEATPVPVQREPEPQPEPAPKRNLPAVRARKPDSDERLSSLEAEEYLLSCCFLDGEETVAKCKEQNITPASFYSPANSIIFETMLAIHGRNLPVDAAIVAEELKAAGRLDSIGGFAYLTQVSSRVPTTAQAPYFIDRVSQLARARNVITLSKRITEAVSEGQSIDDLQDMVGKFVQSAQPRTALAHLSQRQPSDFSIKPYTDSSVLLGNRYLNRGDGIILSGSSGMGKSSIQMQMAADWALGGNFYGIRANGALKSLIIQSEDSDGDIAEVWASLAYKHEWTPEQWDRINANVRIVSDRVNRGARFIAALRKHIEEFKPDIVWINPLQAFIDGDVTDSQDIGAFLREGLNGLNEPARFGYIIIHHTTKPATGGDKSERLWHEVMYDMAGGAELINWARGVISLRATETEGQFKLVLAKRGRRAGIVKEVDQGAGTRMEPVTTLGLKHSTGTFIPPGSTISIPVIFWETCDVAPESSSSEKGGRPPKHQISDYFTCFPSCNEPHATLPSITRKAVTMSGIPPNSFRDLAFRAGKEGTLDVIDTGGTLLYRRKTP